VIDHVPVGTFVPAGKQVLRLRRNHQDDAAPRRSSSQLIMYRSAALLLVLLGGCYGYYPSTSPTPAGHDVEITLTDSGAVALARQVGPSAEAIRGRLSTDSGSNLVLAVTGVRQRDGNDVDWKGERVAIPRPLAAKVTERRFSRARTVLFTAGIAISAIAIRQAFSGDGFSFFGSGQVGKGGAK